MISYMLRLTPTSTAVENEIPLPDVEGVGYEIVDNESISIGWNKTTKHAEDIDVYFDETVVFYALITDQYGNPAPRDTKISMLISASIGRRADWR